MSVVDSSYNQPLKLEERAAQPLSGGLMGNGYQCGMLWGAALAAGAQAYRLFGPGAEAESRAIITAQRLVESFRSLNGHIDCTDIIGIVFDSSKRSQLDKSPKRSQLSQAASFFAKGGPIQCFFNMAPRYPTMALRKINATLSEKSIEAPPSPVSCAAMLAQKMGASDLHTVMAAGFAGGIGLSGDACGALGAAIWLLKMKDGKENEKGPGYDDPIALAAIDRFLKSADYEFECSKIAGRKFENVADHAAYVRDGGCAKIIEVLATHK